MAPSGREVLTAQQFIDRLTTFLDPLAVKLYRLQIETAPRVPVIPCLDHEALLHQSVGSHAAVYAEDRSGCLHEIVLFPDDRRIQLDVVSTMGECSDKARDSMVEILKTQFPGYAIRTVGPSWLRGDRRVARACRAQVTLREVLTGEHLDATRLSIDRLQTISALMEKESRVASWGARTVMTPVLAAAGFVTYQVVGQLSPELGPDTVILLRYTIVGLLGLFFLYYGLKAVHLTEMANRVWKRSAEYGLIVSERKRLRSG